MVALQGFRISLYLYFPYVSIHSVFTLARAHGHTHAHTHTHGLCINEEAVSQTVGGRRAGDRESATC